MKILATISLVLLFCGCSNNTVYLNGKNQKETVSYTTGEQLPSTQLFYIVNLAELKKVPKPLLYRGTHEGYHLFEFIPKEQPRNDEILKVAIDQNRLYIRTALSPPEEMQRTKTRGSRSLTIENGIYLYGSSEKIAKRHLTN